MSNVARGNTPPSPTYRFSLINDEVIREIGTFTFVVNPHERNYYRGATMLSLDETGKFILKQMEGGSWASTSTICNRLISQLTELPAGGKEQIQQEVAAFIDELWRRGMIARKDQHGIVITTDQSAHTGAIPNPMRPKDMASLVAKQFGPNRQIFEAGIELTSVCNLRCVHCYNADESHTSPLSTEDVKRILDDLAAAGVISIYFTGGEILTRQDFVEVYLYAKGLGFIIELLTNGTLIDADLVEVFEEYPPANVSISVYGASEETYGAVTGRPKLYYHLLEGIRLLHEHDIVFELKFIGTNENRDDLDAVRALAAFYNVPFNYTYELFPRLSGNKANLAHQVPQEVILAAETRDAELCQKLSRGLITQKRRIPNPENAPLYLCSIARFMVLIDYEGFIEPCTMMRTKRWNMLRGELDDAWADFERYIHYPAPRDYRCLDCDSYVLCTPCVEKNRLYTGDPHQPNEAHCALVAARVEEFSKAVYDHYRHS